MRQCRATEDENSQALRRLLPLLGERVGVRASVSVNLIFGVVGSDFFQNERTYVRCYAFHGLELRTRARQQAPLLRRGWGWVRDRCAGPCRQAPAPRPPDSGKPKSPASPRSSVTARRPPRAPSQCP